MADERWRVRAVPLPEGGEPVTWWVADGRLSAAPVDGARDLPGGWLAPGLVDAHVHLTFEARDRLGLERGTPELVAAQLDLHRRAGVLAVRDAGSLPSVPLGALAEPGGRVAGCGPFLAPPGFFLAHLYAGTPPERAVQAARDHVRAGWPWVKLVADYPPPGGTPFDARPGYPFDLMAAIVDAVHAEGGRVAAHVMGQIVAEVVATGLDSVEHGNWATEDDVAEMARRGTAWTPTLTTVLGHVEPIAEHVPPARALLERQRRTLPLAAELGVTVLAGTDEEPHGSLADEVAALVRYGLPPQAAIAAASTGARAFLGLPGLEDGAPADLVTFAADPRADVAAVRSPAAVLADGTRLR
jgi:imidazolonepropionase-like amidohydrolase